MAIPVIVISAILVILSMILKTIQEAGPGLRGQVAGVTALCACGREGSDLRYRGYDVAELAGNCQFEEVAHLLLRGELPNVAQLDQYKEKLQSLRWLPGPLRAVLERIPGDAHPTDVMRTACSLLGTLETETDFSEQQEKADRLLAVFPGIICYWYRYARDGMRIETETDDGSIAGHFLHMLHGSKASVLHRKVMQASLVLYAEHEFTTSTFNARIAASTLADFHSCITGAIGALRGPLHGGATEATMVMLAQWRDPDQAEAALLGMLARKERVMGFGHAVYKECDPRNAIIRKWSEKLAEETGDTVLYPVSVRCEEVMWREKRLFCNTDFFHASAYHFMGIPTRLFTPIFILSRITGWAAHVFEQRANNRIIRPSADYTGPEPRPVPPLVDR